jgi:hypothetical protein
MQAPKLPTDRSFGLLFTVVFALLAGWSAWRGGHLWPWWAGASGLFLVVSLIVPRILRPLNVAWMWLGLLLSMIVSPIVMGLIYFIVVTPMALFFKLTGRDALMRKYQPALGSYWIKRDPPGPDGPSSFPNQF